MQSRAPRILAVEPPPIYGPRKPHHKKRIAKKWLKRYGKKIIGYDRYLGDKVVMLKDQVGFGGQPVAVCHTDIARRLVVACCCVAGFRFFGLSNCQQILPVLASVYA